MYYSIITFKISPTKHTIENTIPKTKRIFGNILPPGKFSIEANFI